MTPKPITSIPISDDASPVERWWLTVRRQTFRQLPLETALSLPIPVLQANSLYLTAFYYGVKRVSGPGTSQAMPPVARVSATYPEGRLLSFLHRKVENLFPDLPASGILGPLTVGQASPDERMQARRVLFVAYSNLLDLYQNEKSAKIERKEFTKAFNKVAEPALLPYYHALNPGFFEWLEGK